MEKVQITSLSSKGQVVIPNVIRKKLHLDKGAKFMIITDGSNILLKPIELPKVKEFNNLIERSKKIQRELNLSPDNLKRIVRKVRCESSN